MFSVCILVLFMQNVKFLHPIFLGKDPDKGKRNAFRSLHVMAPQASLKASWIWRVTLRFFSCPNEFNQFFQVCKIIIVSHDSLTMVDDSCPLIPLQTVK